MPRSLASGGGVVGDVGVDLVVLGGGEAGGLVDDLADERGEIDRLGRRAQVAGLYAGQLEDAAEGLQQAMGGAADLVEVGAERTGAAGRCGQR